MERWNPQLTSVCLQLGRKGSHRMHIFSCYAPTRVTARSVKDEFYTDMDVALFGVPE